MFDDCITTGDVIVAWAGAATPSAIGMVRLSGKGAHDLAGRLAGRVPDATGWHGRDPQAFFTHIRTGDGSRRLIDECMAIWYRSPYSYTGEDMVELSIHGNPLLAREVVETCIAAGARDARPGEFTARAFLNGRIDLTQAEAVQEIIGARSRSQLELARNMLKGELRRSVDRWYERLVAVRARLEVVFDYPGDTSDASYVSVPGLEGSRAAAPAPASGDAESEALRETLAEIEGEITGLLEFHDRGRAIREGTRVVLVGPPNVGKSSLFNSLSGFDRALTDHEPGTTRDYLELTLGWDRLTITLVDTAGLRDSADRVEAAGIALTEKKIGEADVVIYVIDASACVDPEAGILGAPQVSGRQRLVHVFNKIDKADAEKLANAPEILARYPECTAFLTSVKKGAGIAELRRWLVDNLSATDTDDRVLLTDRHRTHVDSALAALRNASESLRLGVPTDIVVIDVADAMKALARITGRDVLADVFDSIFGNFCVGK